MRTATLAAVPSRSALPRRMRSRSASTEAGASTAYPDAFIALSVLNSDSYTPRNAAVPVAPPFGGKLNRTIATLRFERSLLRRRIRRSTRSARRSTRSGCGRRSRSPPRGGAVQASAENDRRCGAVELGDRHHHGRFDRRQASVRGFPLLDRLKFERMGGYIGDVEFAQKIRGAGCVVVGRAADQRKAGQGNESVDRRNAVPLEEGLDRRARIEAAREGRNDPQSPLLQRRDHGVVVGRVVGEKIGTHQQEADRSDGLLHGWARQRI